MKNFQFSKREISKQFIKFCLIGFESTVLNYLTFLILFNFFSTNYLFSSGIGFVVGTFFGFIFNKKYTFDSNKESKKEVLPYFLVYLFSLLFTIFAMKILVEFIQINPLIANIFVIAITTILNFFGTKIFAFKNEKW